MIKVRLLIKINTSFVNLKQLFQYINLIIKSTLNLTFRFILLYEIIIIFKWFLKKINQIEILIILIKNNVNYLNIILFDFNDLIFVIKWCIWNIKNCY